MNALPNELTEAAVAPRADDPTTPVAWRDLDETERSAVLARPPQDRGELESVVTQILETVRAGGDNALRDYAERFDGVTIADLVVDPDTLAQAREAVDPGLMTAIEQAAARIRRFHEAGAPRGFTTETAPGLECQARYVPISPVGLYVPGGSAPLISTVLMLAIPASIAGCGDMVLCTPPGEGGRIDPALLAAAHHCGVRRVIRAGGAQAIAAMAFGTESVPACAKLYGPGNAWVTEAKRQVSAMPGGAAQDLPAGPSEVLVIADGEADADAVAWDLLSQAEHGPDSQAVLLSDSARLLSRVAERLPVLAAQTTRAGILEDALQNLRLIEVDSTAEGVSVSNRYAPEHLIVNTADADDLLVSVTAAGSVFLGRWTPESLGDYSSGTNHVLPTYGYARAYSGLSVTDFMRRMTVQRATPAGLAVAGRDAMRIAEAEGLDAHRMAVACRLRREERDEEESGG
ncbi:MAG: histidinol dehydrogenase [Xanthomonadales bacterium]|jgi:histidinol dehydrogenase|nr:histidinol dehydrogenase [Xanthomonadales bacterium]